MLPIIIALGVAALVLSGGEEKKEELTTKSTENTKKRKKYSKAFILASGKWLKDNKPPEEWEGSKLEYALEEMPYDGEVYEA